MEKNYISILTDFIDNEGLIDKNRPPKCYEPFYANYMEHKINSMGIKLGDRIEVITDHGDQIKGILTDDVSEYSLELLTRGKKVWSSRKNIEHIDCRIIKDVRLLESSPDEFDIYSVNPNYVSVEERKRHMQEYYSEYRIKKHEISEEDAALFKKLYPDTPITDCCILYIQANLYWKYCHDIILSEISIVKKDGTTVPMPKTLVRQVYPNKDWYSTCMKGADGIMIPFASFEELQEISHIACLWTVETGKENNIRILSMNYPVFKENPVGYNIFSVCMHHGNLSSYADSLLDSSPYKAYAESLLTDYDDIAVILKEEDVYFLKESSEEMDEKMMDVVMALHSNSLQQIIDTVITEVSDRKDYVELFIYSDVVEAEYHSSDIRKHDDTEFKKNMKWLSQFT